ncbi:hypothetical protein [Flaviaesturariibacter terrae]
MPEEVQHNLNPGESRRRRRSSRSNGSRAGSGHGHRRSRSSSSSSTSKNKFTIGQALLLIWSAGTLGTLLYLVNDVHRAPLPAVAGLAGAALIGLLFFFRGLRKKKRK